MRRPPNQGIASTGVHHAGKVASQWNCMFEAVDQNNDVGIDAWMELVVDGAATGCWIGLQIKAGKSYCHESGWRIPADVDHLRYWRSHCLPICGVVYDPESDEARWVDITAFIDQQPTEVRARNIPVPEDKKFDGGSFAQFRDHFMAYRAQFSDNAHFGQCLRHFSNRQEPERCASAMRALFGFHRDKPEAWYYMILSLTALRDRRLIGRLAVVLAHIPGHGDIFWHRNNIISEATREAVVQMLQHLLSRDSLVALLGTIDAENGIGRGSIGQCVCAITMTITARVDVLTSIIRDIGLPDEIRSWAALLLIYSEQRRETASLVSTLESTIDSFQDETGHQISGLLEALKRREFIDFS